MNRSQESGILYSMTDHELSQALKNREPSAPDILVQRFHDPLVRYLWSVCGDRDDAHDLAHETLITALEKISGHRDGDLKPWLFRIAHRRFLMLRRRSALQLGWLRATADKPLSFGDHMDGIVILGALAEVPVSQKEAFVLCEVLGFSIEEAAMSLGTFPGTIKSRCFHARQKLQKILASSFELSDAYPTTKEIAYEEPVTE